MQKTTTTKHKSQFEHAYQAMDLVKLTNSKDTGIYKVEYGDYQAVLYHLTDSSGNFVHRNVEEFDIEPV